MPKKKTKLPRDLDNAKARRELEHEADRLLSKQAQQKKLPKRYRVTKVAREPGTFSNAVETNRRKH